MLRFLFRLGCVTTAVSLATASSPKELVVGANNLQAAAYHAASGDILVVADPSLKKEDKGVSVAVLPSGSPLLKNFTTLPVLDDGSRVITPVDIAMAGDTAYVADQGNPGIVAFTRSSGEWKYSSAWRIRDLLPACDEFGRSFGRPESVVVSPQGEIFVAMTVVYHTRCLHKPLDRCCNKESASTLVMRLNIPNDGSKASFHHVFDTRSILKLGYHMRALDLVNNGDIVFAGFGDDMGGYFAHSVWLWKKATEKLEIIAGQTFGQDGHTGDGGPATNATLNLPWGIAMMPSGDFYISEAGNQDIRVVEADTISTFYGDWVKQPYENMHPRKIHVSKPNTLLFAICGLGENEGRLLEFEVASAQHGIIV